MLGKKLHWSDGGGGGRRSVRGFAVPYQPTVRTVAAGPFSYVYSKCTCNSRDSDRLLCP